MPVNLSISRRNEKGKGLIVADQNGLIIADRTGQALSGRFDPAERAKIFAEKKGCHEVEYKGAANT